MAYQISPSSPQNKMTDGWTDVIIVYPRKLCLCSGIRNKLNCHLKYKLNLKYKLIWIYKTVYNGIL